ncbi:hypothetical protein V5799_018493 [Amblyomma americanum]|uniref:Ig-like domain-containing protein n=1 Tax=Amblyomma americanum TaxID=6943 RepID=A0AAQ4EZX5_AMBAM
MQRFVALLQAFLCGYVLIQASAKLLEPPKLQPLTFPRNPALNKKVVVSCVAVEGDAPLEFTWTKDGTSGHYAAKRYSTSALSSHISTLTILQLTAQDNGNYTCHVSNAAGTDSSTASLLVQGQFCLLHEKPSSEVCPCIYALKE